MIVPSADITELAPAPLQGEAPQPSSLQAVPQEPAPFQYAPSPLQPAPRSASAAGSSSRPLYWIVGIGGGLAALVVVVLIAVVLSSSGGAKKAKAPDANAAQATSVAPPLPRRKAPSFDRPKPAPPSAAKSNPFESPPAVAPVPASSSSTEPVVDSPDFGQPAPGTSAKAMRRAPPPIATRSISALPHGLAAWYEQPRNSLSGVLNPSKTDDPTVAHISWMAGLLPYLGYQEKYDKLKLDESIDHAANIEVAETVIPEFQNPLDGRTTWEGYPFDGLALTHFAGMSGIEDARNVSAAKLPRSDPRAGVFGYDEVARPAAITDGTSQTIMIVGSGRLAGPWIMGGGATIRGAREPLFNPMSGLGTQGLSGGGTIAVMADGSVRHISAAIAPPVFKAMCTIHGQEVADPDKHAPEFDLRDLR